MQSIRTQVDALAFKGRFKSRASVVIPGLFRALRRTEAVWTYLLLAGIPQTAEQILEGIQRGQYKTRAMNELAATQAALRRGVETGRFRLYGTHHWAIVTPTAAELRRVA